MGGKGRACRTIRDRRCTLALDGLGGPITLSRCCQTCDEWRCRRHCKCGREGSHQPRRNPRSAKRKVLKKSQKKNTQKRVAPVLPVAARRPETAPLSLQVYRDESWLADMIAETRQARTWHCASLVFDEPETKKILLERLRSATSSRPFECKIVVDGSTLKAGRSSTTRACLRDLAKAGATVALGRGKDHIARRVFGPRARGGVMHAKAVAIDNTIVYSGGANVTSQSRCNRELVYRITGPPVADVMAEIQAAIAEGAPLGRG